jgi:hypothetical protein
MMDNPYKPQGDVVKAGVSLVECHRNQVSAEMPSHRMSLPQMRWSHQGID